MVCGCYVTHHLDKHFKRFHNSALSVKSSKNQASQSKKKRKEIYILSVGSDLFLKKKNNQYNILIDFLSFLQEYLELPCQLRIFIGRKSFSISKKELILYTMHYIKIFYIPHHPATLTNIHFYVFIPIFVQKLITTLA